MATLDIVQPVAIEGEESGRAEGHILSLVKGEPAAVDGISPVIIVQIADPERDAATLLRAAEQLLPIHRQAPGIVVTDEKGAIEGIVPRADLEEAVLRMRDGEFAVLAKGLGLRDDYRPPAGDMLAPFVYWRCPQCEHIYVPAAGDEEDIPRVCEKHDPPVQMERRVHSRR